MNLTSKHTPGPWEVDCQPGGAFEVASETAGNSGGYFVICKRSNHDSRADEMWANGCLIAAAPELLDALQGLLLRVGNNPDLVAEVAAADAAISRARGWV